MDMTDDEQSLLALGVQLHDGLRNMLAEGRLRDDNIPDDYEWLVEKLDAMSELLQSVKA